MTRIRAALAPLLTSSLLFGDAVVGAEDGAEQGVNKSAIDDLRSALQSCRAMQPEADRLGCYDLLAKMNAPPDFAGKLGFRTPQFDIAGPTRLRFRSQGVIFVLYVLGENGEVLQNLHLGGGGEGDYLIRDSGRYSLQIDGSARWQIWLEPVEEITSK